MLTLSTLAKNELLANIPFRLLFNGGYIWLYNGTRPTHPDYDVTGTLIATVTNNGNYPILTGNLDISRNGLSFEFSAYNGILFGSTRNLLGNPIWKLHVLQVGTPTWFRFTFWNDSPVGHSINRIRMDGDIGTDLVLLTTPLIPGSSQNIDDFKVYI